MGEARFKRIDRYKHLFEGQENKKPWKEMMIKFHDYRPQIVLLTQTSSVPYGYAFKESWKKAFPDEEPPTFLTIDVKKERNFGLFRGDIYRDYLAERGLQPRYRQEDKSLPEYERQIADPEFDNYFKERVNNDNDVVQTKQVIKDKLKRFAERKKLSRIMIFDEMGIFEDKSGNYVPGMTLSTVKNNVDSALRENGINAQVRIEQGYYGGFLKLEGVGPRIRKIYQSKYGEYPSHELLRPNTSEERKTVLENLKYLKHFGREVGTELHVELEQEAQKQKSLEQRLSTIIGMGGIVGSIFFLGSSVTGNAIASISRSSGSWLGIGLLLVGIAGALFYFRSKKR